MFESYRIVFAIGVVISEYCSSSVAPVPKNIQDLMQSIAGERANLEFAVMLLKSKKIPCKYSAAAAIFARLAVATEVSSKDFDVPSFAWKAAYVEAIRLAGLDESEAKESLEKFLTDPTSS